MTEARSAASARSSFFRFQRFLYACDVSDPAECSISSRSPEHRGNFAACAGVISRNICSAVEDRTRSGPAPIWALSSAGAGPLAWLVEDDEDTLPLLAMASTNLTEASVGEPPTSPVP